MNSSRSLFSSLKKILYLLILFFLFGNSLNAQVFPAGFIQVQIATGLNNPTAIAFTPDGRIFVCLQDGKVRVYKNGALLPTVAIDLTVDDWFERGLLGIAFDPNFSTNHYVYLYYTVPGTVAHNRISRFTVNGDLITPASESIVLELDNLNAGNHNGGAIMFGPDYKLYVATGDNAVGANAQSLNTYHGKILRINSDGSAPADNPFIANAAATAKRVWAYGLRNPYTFTFKPVTGELYINDVGQNAWEEINVAASGGLNFGWPTTEGAFNPVTYPNFVNPLYSYAHDPTWDDNKDSLGCAIVGGVFYNPVNPVYPSLYVGKYFFPDLCGSWINYLNVTTVKRFSFGKLLNGDVLGLALGNDGYLYYLNRGNGSLHRIDYTNNNAPVITMQPQNLSVSEGQPATFTVSSSGALPLSYQWRKNGVDISGATSASYTINSVVPSDANTYSVYISNTFGNTTSEIVTLTVTAFNAKPEATITSPVHESLFRAGDVISFSGTATDAEDGTLPASNYKWLMAFHHNTHVHDGPPFATGVTSGTYTIPNVGEPDHDVYYRLYLVVTDANGLADTAYVNLLPRKSTVHLASNIPGLEITLDGQPQASPYSSLEVVGMIKSLGASSPQTYNSKTYAFDYWQHGGSREQEFTTNDNDQTFTAIFKEVELLTATESPIHDAYVRDGANANTTYGTTDPTFLVSKNSGTAGDGFNRECFLTFDISGYTGPIAGAKLRLYAPGIAVNINTAAYGANTNWNENTVTFASKPAALSTQLDEVTVPANAAAAYYEWDVTSHVSAEVLAANSSVSFQLVNTTVSAPQFFWNSKEAVGDHPQLEITEMNDVLSIDESSEINGLTLYPNPGKDVLNIELSVDSPSEARVLISNMLSENVSEKTVTLSSGTNTIQVSTGALSKGVYLVVVQMGNSRMVKKWVVQ